MTTVIRIPNKIFVNTDPSKLELDPLSNSNTTDSVVCTSSKNTPGFMDSSMRDVSEISSVVGAADVVSSLVVGAADVI